MQTKNLCLASVATLIACRSIAQAFSENIFELAHLRSKWSVDYAESLKKRIQEISVKYLSEDKVQLDTEKINAWRELMISSFTDLAIIRASVKVDFKDDIDFVRDFFSRMGYTQYFSEAKNGDHVSMYNFIGEFAGNLTPPLKARLTERGLDPKCIERIIENSKALVQFRDCFEMLNDPDSFDSDGRKKLEDIYSEIQDICRIATAYYHFDPGKREYFNFFKALRKLPV